MELVWDFARQLDPAASPGSTVSYADTMSQSFYIDNEQIKTQIGPLVYGQWQELVRNEEIAISSTGYSALDIEHNYVGHVFSTALHDGNLVMLDFQYMEDPIPVYKTNGSVILGPYTLPELNADTKSSSINWVADIPAGTTLTVGAVIDYKKPNIDQFISIVNGQSIPNLSRRSSGKDLYLLVTMSTENSSYTPSLLDLNIQIVGDTDLCRFVIRLSDAGRLKNPGEDVVVGYTGSQGDLRGLTGTKVLDTSTSFAIEEAEFFNPNDGEVVSVGADLLVSVLEVVYNLLKSTDESVTASASMNVSTVEVVYKDGKCADEAVTASVGMVVAVTSV